MTDLYYRSFVNVDDLRIDECTVHAASDASGGRWWQLWFYVARETDSVPEAFVVPIAPGGSFAEGARRTWGFSSIGGGTWQVSPSINVLDTRESHPGEHPTSGSLWHQTPRVVGVPDDERWIGGQP